VGALAGILIGVLIAFWLKAREETKYAKEDEEKKRRLEAEKAKIFRIDPNSSFTGYLISWDILDNVQKETKPK